MQQDDFFVVDAQGYIKYVMILVSKDYDLAIAIECQP